MSLIQRISPLGGLFIDGRQSLELNRPTLFLACLCVLRTYTSHSWNTIGYSLRENFPELLPQDVIPIAVNLEDIWREVRSVRPEWLDGMQRGHDASTAASILSLLHNKAFCCSCLFPACWQNWEQPEVDDVFRYLKALINAGSGAEAEMWSNISEMPEQLPV